MPEARSRSALELLEEALAQEEGTRREWVARQCGANRALLEEVHALLAADEAAGRLLPSEGLGSLSELQPPPARIGAYRVVRRLGVGGMGEVFLGARDDGLFEHEVAIKVIRPSLLPAAARAMFEKERRALAMLSHKNIARIFDGGVTESGAPFFIMERIEGETIDQHCRVRSLAEQDVARLFVALCAAVQFAHQNLVVHGDLKPANVLVDALGEIKVLDFGVARILADADAEGDLAIFPKTAGYASPARIADAPPTIPDDVFALGVMLAQALSTPLIGDLSVIVERARHNDVAQRYPTAAALAEDLRRWLEHRPLAGRENDLLYAARKFIRRRRLRVVAAGVAILSLVGGLALTTTLYLEANSARARAEARFDDVRGLATYLLYDVYDDLARKPGSLPLRAAVAARAQSYLERIAADPSAGADVRSEVVNGLVRLAEIQAAPGRSNLGENGAAAANLARAESIAAELGAGRPHDTTFSMTRAQIALERAALAMNIDQDFDAAERYIAFANDKLAALGPDGGVLRADALVQMSLLQQWRGEYQAAVTTARTALAAIVELPAPPDTLELRARDALAEALYYAHDVAGAEREYRGLVALLERRAAQSPDDMETLRWLARERWALATTIVDLPGRADEALAQLRQGDRELGVLMTFEPTDQTTARMLRINLAAYAQALSATGRHLEAVALMRRHVAARAAYRDAHPGEAAASRDYAIGLGMLADIYAEHGDTRRACLAYEMAIGVFESLAAAGSLTALDSDTSLAADRTRHRQLCGR